MSNEWKTQTVINMAKTMRVTGDFSALPILADAMEECGFNDIGVLYSARHDPNSGNWIVAYILGEEEKSRRWLEVFVDELNETFNYYDDEYYHNYFSVEKLLEIAKKGHYCLPFDTPEIIYDTEKMEKCWKHCEILLKSTLNTENISISCAC